MRLILPAAIAVALTAAAAITYARSAERAAHELAVMAAWARATPPGAKVGAAYITVENQSGKDDRLLAASSPAAGAVSLHESLLENGVASMRPIENPVIPAGGVLEMRPGGTHLMLLDLAAPLTAGTRVPVTLSFESAGDLKVEVEVVPLGAGGPAKGPAAGNHDHTM